MELRAAFGRARWQTHLGHPVLRLQAAILTALSAKLDAEDMDVEVQRRAGCTRGAAPDSARRAQSAGEVDFY